MNHVYLIRLYLSSATVMSTIELLQTVGIWKQVKIRDDNVIFMSFGSKGVGHPPQDTTVLFERFPNADE